MYIVYKHIDIAMCLYSDKDLGFRIVSLPYEHDGMYFRQHDNMLILLIKQRLIV